MFIFAFESMNARQGIKTDISVDDIERDDIGLNQ